MIPNVNGSHTCASMNNEATNRTIAVSPRIAKIFCAMIVINGFASKSNNRPSCKLPTIGTNATKTSNRSSTSMIGIVVRAIKIAKITKNGTITQIAKIAGTLIPNVAKAITNMLRTPMTTTNQTYAIIGNVTTNVFKKNNTPKPIINHLAIVKTMNAGNPANKLIVNNEANLRIFNVNNAKATTTGIPRIGKAAKALKM